jgi:hypothetical protein
LQSSTPRLQAIRWSTEPRFLRYSLTTAYAFTANGVLTGGLTRQRRSHSPMLPLSAPPQLRALFLWPEVRVDLHPDEKRSWILQID